MAKILKKRALFLVGVTITGVISVFSTFYKNNFSKDSSLLITTAYADHLSGAGDGGGSGGSDGGGGAGCCEGY